MTYQVVGTCSVCGGAVRVARLWYGIEPPVPECSKCGAVAKPMYGPVIEMTPRAEKAAEALQVVPWLTSGPPQA